MTVAKTDLKCIHKIKKKKTIVNYVPSDLILGIHNIILGLIEQIFPRNLTNPMHTVTSGISVSPTPSLCYYVISLPRALCKEDL